MRVKANFKVIALLLLFASAAPAGQNNAPTSSKVAISNADLPQEPQKEQAKTEWLYGGFVDVGYLLDFNHPSNHVSRSRGTAWHVDELDLNMAGA